MPTFKYENVDEWLLIQRYDQAPTQQTATTHVKS